MMCFSDKVERREKLANGNVLHYCFVKSFSCRLSSFNSDARPQRYVGEISLFSSSLGKM